MSRRSIHSATRKDVKDDTLSRSHSPQDDDAIHVSKPNSPRCIADPEKWTADYGDVVRVEVRDRSLRSPADVGNGRSPSTSLHDIPEIVCHTHPTAGDVSARTMTRTADASPETSLVISQTPTSSPRLERPNLTIVTDVLRPAEESQPTEVKQTLSGTPRVHFHRSRSEEIVQVPRTPVVVELHPSPSPISTSSRHSSSTSRSSIRGKGRRNVIQGHWTDAFVAPPVEVPPQVRPEQPRKARRSDSFGSKSSHGARVSPSLNEPPHWSHSLANYVPVPSQQRRLEPVYSPADPTPPVLPEIKPPGFEFQVPEDLELWILYSGDITLPPIPRLSPLDPRLFAEEDDVSLHRRSSDDQPPVEQPSSENTDPLDDPVTGGPVGKITHRFSMDGHTPTDLLPVPVHSAGKTVVSENNGEPSIPGGDNGIAMPMHHQSSFDITNPASTTPEPSETQPLLKNTQPSSSPSRRTRAFRLPDLLKNLGRGLPEMSRVAYGVAERPVAVVPRSVDNTLPPQGHEIIHSDTCSDCGTLATTSEYCICCVPWKS